MYLYLTRFQLTSSSLHILSPFIFPWMGLIHPQCCFSIPRPYQQFPDPDAKCVAHPILVLPHTYGMPQIPVAPSTWPPRRAPNSSLGTAPLSSGARDFIHSPRCPSIFHLCKPGFSLFPAERDPCSWAQHMLDLHGSPSTRLNPVVNP